MTRDNLINYLDRLSQCIHPFTGERVDSDSCLREAPIRAEMSRLVRRLQLGRVRILDRQEIADTISDLRELGYEPTPLQLAKVLTGSRSIADPRLRGLMAYKQYRGLLSQRAIVAELDKLEANSQPRDRPDAETLESTMSDWKAIDFFITGSFDKLDEGKATDLKREVDELGLRKAGSKLPAYMARARERLPRAFEPWTKAEKALLIEAMCYTNDLERLATIFGRSTTSIERQGKQLIWASREKAAA
ncbi:hypothetical protein [Lewinella sp. IMCC34191]|uniref:hypothetical protein n=1 Tax=Lewinella sp. IMCC34191 TaxID=2259172 RepID=UPI000E2463B9|nr:hypothetical protein [Lewinella sp. IMCC34191]